MNRQVRVVQEHATAAPVHVNVSEAAGRGAKPAKGTRRYVCAYCGKSEQGSKHVCQPVRLGAMFFCQQCGRATQDKSKVCQPEEIE